MEFKIHPAAEMFPEMAADDFAALKEDIRQHGQREPVLAYYDCSGGKISYVVIDGRHRLRACHELGIQPVVKTWQGNLADIPALVVSLNLHRRHLNESQRAMIAARLKPLFEEAAKARMEANLKQNTATLNLEERTSKGEAAAEAAKLVNVSRPAVYQAQAVIQKAVPEVVAAVDAGKISVSDAAKVVDAPPAVQVKAVEMVEGGEAKTLARAVEKIQATTDDEQRRRAERLVKQLDNLIDNLALTTKIGAKAYFEHFDEIDWAIRRVEVFAESKLRQIDRAIEFLQEFRQEFVKHMLPPSERGLRRVK